MRCYYSALTLIRSPQSGGLHFSTGFFYFDIFRHFFMAPALSLWPVNIYTKITSVTCQCLISGGNKWFKCWRQFKSVCCCVIGHCQPGWTTVHRVNCAKICDHKGVIRCFVQRPGVRIFKLLYVCSRTLDGSSESVRVMDYLVSVVGHVDNRFPI